MRQAKFAFINSQSLDQQSVGSSTKMSEMSTLDFEELLECIARCGVDKYKSVREMSEAQGIKGFIENLLGEVSEEHVMISNPYPYPYPYPYSR